MGSRFSGSIRYFFDAGSGVCLWSGDDATNARHGFAIDAADLPLSAYTQRWLQHLIAWYDTSLNWDDPAGDSLWSAEEQARFQQAAQEGVTRLRHELASAGYEVCDESCTSPVTQPAFPLSLRVRIFMPAANPAGANDNERALLAALAAFAPHPIEAPEPYWKFPGWYEHYFALTPADQTTFDTVVALSEGGWEISRDFECEAVWNSSPRHTFLLPGVVWAQILLIYPNSPSPEQEFLPS